METSIIIDTSRRGQTRSLGRPANPLPQLFMESEETNLRYRKDPVNPGTPANSFQTPSTEKRIVLEENNMDSGLGGWEPFSSTSRPSYSRQRYSDLSFRKVEPSIWESFSSPVLDLKNAFKGRPSFTEPGPIGGQLKNLVPVNLVLEDVLPVLPVYWKTQTLVRVGLMLVLAGSLMVSVLMKTNSNTRLNGKQSSIKYGSEQRLMALKRDNRVIDFDIKDESGRVLGGKHASIQFAYDLNKVVKAEISDPLPLFEPEPLRTKRMATPEPVSEPHPSAEPEPISEPHPSAEPEPISEPHPSAEPEPIAMPSQILPKDVSGSNQFSIFELSRKIEELSALLKMEDLRKVDEEFDQLESEIETLKIRKRNLVKKLQQSNKVTANEIKKKNKPVKVDLEEAKESDSTAKKSVKSPKPPKTKVRNPLTESIDKPALTPVKNKSTSKVSQEISYHVFFITLFRGISSSTRV
ncbi:uncharacterized protein LOC111704345 [Eurytemora carolleeae]|uniref:uncharacterized protein LOC111704345 n=1 Tax=Eurytemora carolleeae TaxID=1294199 RepID=UPI000C781FBF|nr:uncharacterized protein LOC111704345 [Eurytemora carolleeae]|eukprot:XP_023332339.1 uncharacterized protein LOC111704345 [Eurytemora affinis]